MKTNLFRKLLYAKGVNFILRNALRPFKSILPKSFLIPTNGVIKINLDKDKSIFIDGNQTCFVTRLLFWHGIKGYEHNVVKIFVKMISEMNCFFDVGANVGYYSFLAYKYNPNVNIYSFEPSPGTYNYLVRNIKLNDAYQYVIPLRLALSNFEGESVFFQHYNSKVHEINQQLGGSSSLSVDDSEKQNYVKIKVNVTTMDKFVFENNIKKVDFIKLDTEATEHLILEGGINVLKKFKPIIICEVLKNKIETNLEVFFDSIGYEYYRVNEKGLQHMKKLHFETYKEDIFFIHPDKIQFINKYLYDAR